MKKLLLLVLAGLFACSTSTSNPPPCEGDDCNQTEPGEGGEGDNKGDGKLSVEGRKIMKNGQEVVLRGMSLYWFNGFWSGTSATSGNRFYTKETVMELANKDTWGANLVRAAIGSVHGKTDEAIAIAKEMIDWTKEAGIYVIIDNHTHIAHRPAPTASAKNFFGAISAYVKEKGYTHVFYEIYNEPVYDCDNEQTNDSRPASCNTLTSWSQIKSYSEDLINTIRGNDPDGIILVGTLGYSQRIDLARADPINARNIMYVLHFYASTHSITTGNFPIRLREAYCADFPVFISEWGTTLASGTGTIDWNANNDWMSFLQAAGLSWANWSLARLTESSAALSNSPAVGTATPEFTNINHQLSTSGQRVQTWIRELNAGRSVEGVNPTPISCN